MFEITSNQIGMITDTISDVTSDLMPIFLLVMGVFLGLWLLGAFFEIKMTREEDTKQYYEDFDEEDEDDDDN
jgi:hypothetical protein